jgi:hypothetical protein
MKKIETEITLKHGGMHNRAGFRAFSKLIVENTFKKARLYHFILKGIPDQPHPTVEDYRKAADTITRLLRGKGIDCFGKGCWEVNELRGLHFHFMLVVEAEYGNVDWWLRVTEDGDLKTMLRAIGVAVHVAPPLNDMHRVGGNKLGKMPLYQYITKSGPKLDDAIKRISYIYKADTKDDSMARIYYSTRNRKVKPAPQPEQVEQADTQSTTNTHDEEDMNRLTAAGFAYLGGLYEHCVDRSMNVVETQNYLASKGAGRPLLQVKHELDHVFGFHGYAASHPAPPLQDHF